MFDIYLLQNEQISQGLSIPSVSRNKEMRQAFAISYSLS
jgi:hypothetical protein